VCRSLRSIVGCLPLHVRKRFAIAGRSRILVDSFPLDENFGGIQTTNGERRLTLGCSNSARTFPQNPTKLQHTVGQATTKRHVRPRSQHEDVRLQ
jgi:hypothetical protein